MPEVLCFSAHLCFNHIRVSDADPTSPLILTSYIRIYMIQAPSVETPSGYLGIAFVYKISIHCISISFHNTVGPIIFDIKIFSFFLNFLHGIIFMLNIMILQMKFTYTFVYYHVSPHDIL